MKLFYECDMLFKHKDMVRTVHLVRKESGKTYKGPL